MKRTLMILALITSLGGAFAVIQRVDSRYATAAEVREVTEKVKALTKEQKRLAIDRDMRDIRARLWAIEDRWAEKFSAQYGHVHDTLEQLLNFMVVEARDYYRKLQAEYEDLEKKLKALSPPETEDE